MEWYALNHPSSNHNSKLRPALPTMPGQVLEDATTIALGSVIYALGGMCPMPYESDELEQSVSDVYYFDTSCNLNLNPNRPNDNGWKSAAPMLNPRIKPAAVALDGKIYVFGGRFFDGDVFAEVFDLKHNTWEVLSDPSPHCDDFSHGYPWVDAVVDSSFSSSSGHHRILVHMAFRNSLHAYCLEDNSWICVDPEFGEWPANLVVVDDVLLCLCDILSSKYMESEESAKCVYAYHLVTNKWLPLYGDMKFPNHSTLLHLGNGKMCLVWEELVDLQGVLDAKCTKFTVKKVATGEQVFGFLTTTEPRNDSFIFEGWNREDFITM